MREAVLKLEVTQYAKTEALLAKEELRENLRQDSELFRKDIRSERNAFYAKVFFVAAFLIGGDVWTMWTVVQHVQDALKGEVEKNRQIVAAVLAEEPKKIQDQIKSVKKDLDQAQRIAAEAQAKAPSASKLADDSIQKISLESNLLTAQVGAVQKQLAGAREAASQLQTVKTDLADTSAALKNQQRQLSDTSELVKMLFSKGQTDQFATNVNSARFIVIPTANRQLLQTGQRIPTGIAFFLLSNAPIAQTVQLEWFVFVQSKSTYNIVDGTSNVLFFRWGDPLDSLKQHPAEVTYIADKSTSAVVKALSVKDGMPFGDGRPLLLDPFSRFLLTPTEPTPTKK